MKVSPQELQVRKPSLKRLFSAPSLLPPYRTFSSFHSQYLWNMHGFSTMTKCFWWWSCSSIQVESSFLWRFLVNDQTLPALEVFSSLIEQILLLATSTIILIDSSLTAVVFFMASITVLVSFAAMLAFPDVFPCVCFNPLSNASLYKGGTKWCENGSSHWNCKVLCNVPELSTDATTVFDW